MSSLLNKIKHKKAPPPPPPRKPAHLSGSTTGDDNAAAMLIRKRCLLWDWTSTRDKIPAIPYLTSTPNLFVSCHNWNAWAPPEIEGKVTFQPMVRVEASLSGNDWAMIADNPHPVIHYLNEPERFNPPMSPARAAEAWRTQMLPLRSSSPGGKKLVGPACASDEGGTRWLDDFMQRVADDPPDFLGLHYYGPNGDAAVAYLQARHALYPNLPVIVSEIACISRHADEVRRFTAQLCNWMDRTDWIAEYGFFGCMQECADAFVSPAAQLMTREGRPTALMDKLMREQPMKP
ncbi:MAG: hypothetical protein M1818_001805 [Claussenomyces sp. TS43310]|nr:MAG: hypothetical protein M1818_001805 [Claussenomyces sp. TS43310]